MYDLQYIPHNQRHSSVPTMHIHPPKALCLNTNTPARFYEYLMQNFNVRKGNVAIKLRLVMYPSRHPYMLPIL
jgi:hypothetical protein